MIAGIFAGKAFGNESQHFFLRQGAQAGCIDPCGQFVAFAAKAGFQTIAAIRSGAVIYIEDAVFNIVERFRIRMGACIAHSRFKQHSIALNKVGACLCIAGIIDDQFWFDSRFGGRFRRRFYGRLNRCFNRRRFGGHNGRFHSCFDRGLCGGFRRGLCGRFHCRLCGRFSRGLCGGFRRGLYRCLVIRSLRRLRRGTCGGHGFNFR